MNLKHYSLLLLAGITYVTTTLAQPRIKDQGVIGGNINDIFTCMHLTKDGGLIVGGYSNSNASDEKTQNKRGDYDYWIVKLDSNKAIQWDKTIGGSKTDKLTQLQQTTDGGYILGGTSNSNISGEKTEKSLGIGADDYWIVKLDANGNIQWDKTIGGAFFDYLTTLQQTADGGYILGGISSSNISYDKTENSRGEDDYWIVKLDANGNIQWDKTIGGGRDDKLEALQQTSDGGYILGGWTYSNKTGDKTEIRRGGYDYWIVKLDASGTIQWDKTIGGSSNDILRALQQTSDGGYILGGASSSNASGEKTETSRGGGDCWIVKLNATGSIQWDKTIGGNTSDNLADLQQTIDGGYILGGYSGSNISGEKTENSRGETDYWIVKTNSQGKVQWDKTLGGENFDVLDVIREIKKNNYAVGGYSYSGISGDKTGGNRGNDFDYADYWLVELKYVKPDSTTVAQVSINNKLQAPQHNNTPFSAFPNPARDKITIQSKGKATFTLTNQQGKTILTTTIANMGIMDVSNVPAGVYHLTNIATGASQRIIVSR